MKITTGLVASIAQTGGSFTYTYDDNGNIASVVQDGVTTAYTYDALGQLVQVDDGQENCTWAYEYDQGGNILSKKKYVDGVETESMDFEYTNENWRDQLTKVNDKTITYDKIGNPLSDGTWTYTWQNGRQLARMQSVDIDASFIYNENGLRVQKTVNEVVTKYTLHGKNIVHMTQGSNELHLFYDAQNKPAVVVYNGNAYSYVKNLQGDIVAILDSSKNIVVSYVYDAWGRPIKKEGSLAATLGTVQPFRYRGYVYDEETGLYYLKVRFYCPNHCRFLCIDTWLGGTCDGLMSHNPISYCKNSPIINEDSNGQFLTAICAAIGTTVVKALVGAVVGAIVNCASEYVDDVVENYKKGERGLDMFVPDSPGEKYVGAAVGGAIAGISSSSIWWTAIFGATGNVVDGWIAGELDVVGALSGDRRAAEDVVLSGVAGAYGNVMGKVISDELLNNHYYDVQHLPRNTRKDIALQWFSGGRNDALRQLTNMTVDEFSDRFFIRYTIMPACYATTTNWLVMQSISD